jgi:hypothetical protein
LRVRVYRRNACCLTFPLSSIDYVGERQGYDLTLQICNVHVAHENFFLFVTVNGSNLQQLCAPYTKGEWGYSHPIRINVGRGDTLKIERSGGKFGLTAKDLILMHVGGSRCTLFGAHDNKSPHPVVNPSNDTNGLAVITEAPKPETRILGDPSATAEKKVKVFVLLGQSNMVGMGRVQGADTDGTLEYAVKVKQRYPFLIDCCGKWKSVVNNRVRNVFTMGSGTDVGKLQKNEWLTVDRTNKIGPEIGIGYELGKWLTESNLCPCSDKDDILILKSCIGNRSLGWDLLPPGSPSFEYSDEKNVVWHYAGYRESPNRWEKGTKPVPIGWVRKSWLFW